MHLKTVLKYMRRSPYQSISAALIMTLTFFTISVFAFLTILSVRLIDYLESSPQLTVFFQDAATIDQINSLKGRLEATGKTISVRYVSKKEALQIYKQQNKNDPDTLDLVTADILPPSLDIQSSKAEHLSTLVPLIKQEKNIDRISYQKDIVDKLVTWTNGLRIVGVSIISILVMVSLFVILTIIGIKITVRREEIEIMKLIGASNWFIRTPFLLEGMMYGFFGALVGWAFSYGILLIITPQIEGFLVNIPILPISPFLALGLLGVEIMVACFLGAFASFVAVLRYLK
ncbi:MAG: ABC transporter permease [Candidatus Levybacteria bacterium]|nr:ABC transporter permease [Candidatus Levybacteria bacterium]MBP9815305.1 ABC transporter permease [Candidatus Levybacteria bacterium]